MAADAAGLTLAFVVAEMIFGPGARENNRVGLNVEVLVFLASLPAWFLVARAHGLYANSDDRTTQGTVDDLAGVLHLVALGGWLLFFAAYVTGLASPDPAKFATFMVAAGVSVTGCRVIARAVSRRQTARIKRAVVVGAGRVGQLVARKLQSHPEYGVQVVGFVDANPLLSPEELGGVPIVGQLGDLRQILDDLDVDRVVVAFSGEAPEHLASIMSDLRSSPVAVDIVPRLFDYLGPNAFVQTVEGFPLVTVPPLKGGRIMDATKRVMDVVVSALALIVFAPLLAAIAIRIKHDSPGPVMYAHERVGRGGTPFRLNKFRTMYIEQCRGEDYGGDRAEETFATLMEDPERRLEFRQTYKLRDDPRVTKVGAVLRKNSLDELPQLWNVLRGDISLVGPRPVTRDELVQYGADATELLTVRPGLTGYWQINGRSDIQYNERVRLDKAYLQSRSVRLDVTILAKTARVLLSRTGAF